MTRNNLQQQRQAVKRRARRALNKTGQFSQLPESSATQPAPEPTSEEIYHLVTLFNLGHYTEGEAFARRQTKRFPQHGFGWMALGVMLKLQGRTVESLESMQKAAILLPMDAEAHFNLGNTLKDLGRQKEAKTSYRRALELKPDYVEAHCNLGNTLKDLGRLEEAEISYRQALGIKPDFAEAHYYLGNTLNNLGRLEEAEASYRQALEIKQEYLEARYNLGNTLKDLGRLEEGEASYRRALEIKPNFAEAYSNLGNTLKDLGQLEEAEACYRRALEIKPNFAEAHSNLGNALKDLGRLEEGEASYRRALEIKPDFAEAYSNLGSALMDLGRMDEAEANCRRALEIKPNFAEAHSNLGSALMDLGRMDEAEACCQRALKIKPNFAEAHSNLGGTLMNLGRTDEAEASCRRALEIKPDALQYAVHAHLMLPIIPESLDAVATWLELYNTGITTLNNLPGTLKDPANNCNPSSFGLAYYNHNDRSVLMNLHHIFRKRVPELTATAPHIQHWSPPMTSGRRIRVGFLSEFLIQHTIGKLYQGYICHLDRSRFEVVVIHTPKAKRDSFSQRLNTLADKSIVLPVSLAAQQDAIAEEKLDVLFFPDIGMAPSSYFLAYARLAPVQAVSWGHPDTTGLDTLDYFVSSTFIEPGNAEEHYSERLICLNRLPCYYQALLAPTQIPTRLAMGLPETGILYGCPQSLFKFHPEFDAVLAAIAEGDPTGHIVLLEGKYHAWTNLLRARWAKSFPLLLERVLFLPRIPQERFMEFIAHLDILLDPIHFGSGNTLYEGMVYGTPIVTWPGRFMRGRIVAGAYRQMGVEDAPIAASLEEYAPLALALGRDLERRRALRQMSLETAGRKLFADMLAVREFEVFLEASVEAAGRREKLPRGWRPDMQANYTQQRIST